MLIGEADDGSYIRTFSNSNASLAVLNSLEQKILRHVSRQYEIENRVQERLSNNSFIQGMAMILGAFCVLRGYPFDKLSSLLSKMQT